MGPVVDWLFQPQCAACGAAATTLCTACRASLLELGPACPRCGEPGPASCPRCARHPLPLDRVIAPWRFGGQLAAALRRLKFSDRAHVARDLAPLWAPALAAVAVADDADDADDAADSAIVVAVPLHWRRRLRRGYDHAWLLAVHACALAGLPPPVRALRRIRHGPAQSTLPAADRAANVHGAFALTRAGRARIAGRAVVLVDDVMTTGATLAAAARPLRDAGATAVTGLVVARAISARG